MHLTLVIMLLDVKINNCYLKGRGRFGTKHNVVHHSIIKQHKRGLTRYVKYLTLLVSFSKVFRCDTIKISC